MAKISSFIFINRIIPQEGGLEKLWHELFCKPEMPVPLLIHLFCKLDFVYEFLKQGGSLCLSVSENQHSHLAETVSQTGIFMFWAKGVKIYFCQVLRKTNKGNQMDLKLESFKEQLTRSHYIQNFFYICIHTLIGGWK